MDQRISVITLGVKDLKKSLEFYQTIVGWVPSSASTKHIAFFQIGGLVFSLYSKESLVQEVGEKEKGQGFSGITFSHNVNTKEEVDRLLESIRIRGGHILKSPQEVFWGGYSGYFSDPDGYVFEVAWNPFWHLREGGEVTLP